MNSINHDRVSLELPFEDLNVFEKFKLCNEPLTWLDGDQYNQRVIVCAANLYIKQDGWFLVVPCVRHSSGELHKLVEDLLDFGIITSTHSKHQGFIDQYSNWWPREEALVIANNAGQVNKARNGSDKYLFSEGLY